MIDLKYSHQFHFIGPYYGVIWPKYYLYEGGMSAFGSALEFGLKLHPAYVFAQKCMLDNREMVLKKFFKCVFNQNDNDQNYAFALFKNKLCFAKMLNFGSEALFLFI